MTATKYAFSERPVTFALLVLGVLVAGIGILDLLGWLLDIPFLTMWKTTGTQRMSPSTGVLTILFGSALCLSARESQGPLALLLITFIGMAGTMTALFLLTLRLQGVYLPAELLGLHVTNRFDNMPVGYISPTTALCFLLVYGPFLASVPYGARRNWRGWILFGFGGLILLLSFVFLLAHIFGIPLILGKTTVPTAFLTCITLFIMGLGDLLLAVRYTGRPAALSDANGPRLLPYALLFLVFVVGIFGAAYYLYHASELRLRREVEAQLITVSDLKADELVRWRRERLWDGILSQNRAMTEAVRQLLETPDSVSARQNMQEQLGKYQSYFQNYIGYDRAYLIDAKGITLMSVLQKTETAAAILVESAVASLRRGQVMLQDFYRDEHDQRIYLALHVPIFDKQDGNQPLGVVVLRIDPAVYLYPHIKSWPATSDTAETLLVRQEGNDVLFLNELRFTPNAALTLRRPLAGNSELPAAKAVLGQIGIVEGVDYRGVPVIAAVGAVPDSPWYIETRMDTAEVYVSLRERMWLTLFLLSILVGSAGVVLILLWRQQQMAFYRRQFELTLALEESHERFEFALQKSHTGGWELNLADNTTVRTLEHDRIFGYDSLLPRWTYEMFLEHVLAEDRPEVDRRFREALATNSDWIFECRIIRCDGQERWIWAVGGHVRSVDGGKGRVAGIVQDITERKQAEEALRESEARLDFALQNSFIGAWEMDIKEHTVRRTPIHDLIYGYETMLPCWTYEIFLEHVLPEDRQRVDRIFHEALAAKADWNFEFRIRRADGEVRWIYAAGGHMRDSAGKPERVSGIVQDITERKQAEINLQLAASVFTHAREGIMITASDGAIIDVNDAFCDITGYSHDEILGQNPRILKSGRHEEEFYADMWHDLIEQGRWQGEFWSLRKNGEVHPLMSTISAVRDEQGDIRQYVALYTDITALKLHQEELERRAHFDALTSLPNRVLLADRLQQSMVQSRRRGQRLAVVFLDIDGFKAINDNYGHEAGDQLLITLAIQMKQALREGDTLSRLGGDEFVAVLLDTGDIDACEPVLNRLITAAAEPVQIGEITLQVSASLGVTFYPQVVEIDAEQLLRQADHAMYQAKQAGKNRYYIFDADQDSRIRSLYESLDCVRRALSAGEFVLYYQPKVNMRTGEVLGAEALIRWQHPEKGLLLPDQFLPVIQDHLLGIELGEWVIDTVLLQMESWRASGLNLPLSINISAHQLRQPDFAERLRALLAAHPNIRPGDVELEVLETHALEDLFQVSRVIDACRKMGVSFALDDFGSGCSSLSYLKYLPVTRLKIDQRFVSGMIDNPDYLSIVEGVIGLGNAFRLLVIAEGAETVEHCTILLQLGCDQVQGYGIARPMPAQQLPAWKAAWRPDPVWSESPSFNRGDLLLLFASVEHRAWIVAMEKYLKGERKSPLPLDINQCRFGQWLNTDGLTRFGEQPNFQDLDQLHRRVHALATELCKLHEQNHNQEALARMRELYGLRDSLLEQLKLMQ